MKRQRITATQDNTQLVTPPQRNPDEEREFELAQFREAWITEIQARQKNEERPPLAELNTRLASGPVQLGTPEKPRRPFSAFQATDAAPVASACRNIFLPAASGEQPTPGQTTPQWRLYVGTQTAAQFHATVPQQPHTVHASSFDRGVVPTTP